MVPTVRVPRHGQARTVTHRQPMRVPKSQVFTYSFRPASVISRPAVRPLRRTRDGSVFCRLKLDWTLSPGNLFLRSGSIES